MELQRVWYQKLKDSGFKDIEYFDGRHHTELKITEASYFPKQYRSEEFMLKREYFERASRFLFEHTFDSRIDEEIWKQHADGFSVREIARHLEAIGFPRLKYTTIHKIIARLKQLVSHSERESD